MNNMQSKLDNLSCFALMEFSLVRLGDDSEEEEEETGLGGELRAPWLGIGGEMSYRTSSTSSISSMAAKMPLANSRFTGLAEGV